ncbi:MAG: HDOD domain-containing protein [Chloroflexi bacterium]|nr:HDOD domain-containing protein [Chloroflexota bacterium]MDA1240765.1 HDOD domain-containing protein [Chloroflexota bacterium]
MAILGARPGQQPDRYEEALRRQQSTAARDQERGQRVPTLDELVVQVAELAPLPAVAGRILALSGRADFSAHDLAAIIASDQALTTRLLRLANSAYYGAPRRIGTVRDAVVLLGFRAVQQVALASCMMQRGRPSTHLDYERFWHFSITTALLAEVLARVDGEHLDVAFTAGVVHNVGLLALDQHRPDLLGEAIARSRAEPTSVHQAEHALLGYTDADLGAALVEHWNFPSTLVEAVRDHARPLDDPPAEGSLAAHVLRARVFARASGLTEGLERGETQPVADEAWLRPPLSITLDHAGGLEQVLARTDAFLAATRA